MKDIWKIKASPFASERSIIKGDFYRFIVLTSRLIRMEYAEDGIFEDRATQTVINRSFCVPEFTAEDFGDSLKIKTEHIELTYKKGEFTKKSLTAKPNTGYNGVDWCWWYGKGDGNLMGTARTLDGVNGACELENGIMSNSNMQTLDDSTTLAITADGWVEPRAENKKDIYLFAYGKDYLVCLKDFYKLTGNTPMLPRFALGNWWSRYYPYSDTEYLELMDKFKIKNIPLSCAVIDMDWHKVEIDKKYGTGWTGFSWNRELFKNPEGFLTELHKRGLKTTLNLHPADGVRGFEDMYTDVAKTMGVDYENEEPVEFDVADPKLLEAYFDHIIYPYEKMGVDFWWMDWQQGCDSKIEGLDPLWMLNHIHYLDNNKAGGRGIAFSRYAGVGSHRYPIGFSGDTHMTWDSLDFQPYFTATASNVGYG